MNIKEKSNIIIMQLYNYSIRALLSSIDKSVLASELLKIVSYSRIS